MGFYRLTLIAPRAPALNLLTARGGLETAFQKKLSGARSRYALSCPDALICVRATFCYLLAFLLSARRSCQNAKKRGRRSCQNAKMRGRAASDQAVKPPWLTLSIAARPPSRHTSHSRSAPRLRRRSFSHGNGIAAPTTACCCRMRITSLRRFWLLRVPASRPHIVSVFVNAASSLRLDLARSARSRP